MSASSVPLADAIQIAVGGFSFIGFVCALREGDDVACWGSNSSGQLGDPSAPRQAAPQADYVEVSGLTNAVDIAAGSLHACALEDSGQVYCWGGNTNGHLGVDPSATEDDVVLSPSAVVGLDDVIDIEAGLDFTCARRRSGQVVCWGDNTVGQLGDGTAVAREDIRNVVGLP